MLTSEIKQKIDNARNILVGKIPTPTGQVEQITLALVYKFMNDIDEQNKELGGSLKFFVGDYQKYAWKNLIDKSLSAYERVTSYGEGLDKMHLNPNLPQFFRNVFRGAFLPFRDPEVLTLFLKQIDEFRYGHNGDLGDAFEYLLQVMGTQGDAGQFLTPRHIINFIVSVVDPQKTDKILDPAVGTAGFLISTYQHLLKHNTQEGSNKPGSALTVDDRKRLANNFVGYDVSHDLVRLSLVNLYLHNFGDPKIFEYDTLGNVDRWDDDFDCILTNPPFMTPKGGVKPHKKFSIQAKRSEVLFVDYIMEHLNPNGKAGIIVPEGIIFQSATAYKALRKMMIEQNFLYAVVSLPAGIFQPYSGVKTSILLMDRVLAKKTKDILFVKVENDGFDLGAQRRSIEKNDLPKATEILKKYKMSIQTGKPFELPEDDGKMANLIPIEKIGKSGDYNLSGDRYKETVVLVNQKWPLAGLDSIQSDRKFAIVDGPFGTQLHANEYTETGIPVVRVSNLNYSGSFNDKDLVYITDKKFKELERSVVFPGDIIIAKTGATIGKSGMFPTKFEKGIIASSCIKVSVNHAIIYPQYVLYLLSSSQGQSQIISFASGSTRDTINIGPFSQIKIPLPPLEVQQEIVSHLDRYQKIIDGAKQVVDNYKPEIKIDPDWEKVSIGDMAKVQGGFAFKSQDMVAKDGAQIIKIGNVKNQRFDYLNNPSFIDEDLYNDYPDYQLSVGDILISMTGTAGKRDYGNVCMVDVEGNYLLNQRVGRILPNSKVINKYLFFALNQDETKNRFYFNATGGIRQGNISNKQIELIKIPLPPLDIQKQIVSRIEEERQLVDATKKLIGIYQGKIKEKIDEVWGE